MTNNLNQKIKKSKQEQTNLAFSRKQKRSKAYRDLLAEGLNPHNIHQFIFNMQSTGKGTGYHILSIFLYMSSKGLDIITSTKYLAKKIGVHEKHISRVTAILEALGLIKKYWRGFKKSRRYKLECLFHNPIIQFAIHGLFPFMKAKAAQFFRDTGQFVEQQINEHRSYFSLHVTHTKQCTYINNNYKEEKQHSRYQKRDETQPVGNNFQNIGLLLQKVMLQAQKC